MSAPDRGPVAIAEYWHFAENSEALFQSGAVAVEEPLTLFVNGRELVTLVMTPTEVPELIFGFLAAEGFIHHARDLTVLQHHPEEGQVWVRIPGLDAAKAAESFGRRYLSSCCGRGRPGFYLSGDEGVEPLPPDDSPLMLSPAFCRHWMERFHQWCRQQQQSRGLHGAALVNPPSDSPFWLAALDVGRHNAIDKVWGFCLRQGVAPRGRILLFSGRLSAEVLIKTAKMAVPVILSNAAPTSLGVELARSLGVTAAVVGHDALTVYSHPERIQGPTQLRTESTSSNPLP